MIVAVLIPEQIPEVHRWMAAREVIRPLLGACSQTEAVPVAELAHAIDETGAAHARAESPLFDDDAAALLAKPGFVVVFADVPG